MDFHHLLLAGLYRRSHNPRCHHNQRLDLEKLRDRFGPDALAMADDLIPLLKCAKCGGKKVGMIYAPDSTKVSGMGKRIPPNALR
jgi:hypothetical protein